MDMERSKRYGKFSSDLSLYIFSLMESCFHFIPACNGNDFPFYARILESKILTITEISGWRAAPFTDRTGATPTETGLRRRKWRGPGPGLAPPRRGSYVSEITGFNSGFRRREAGVRCALMSLTHWSFTLSRNEIMRSNFPTRFVFLMKSLYFRNNRTFRI